MARWLKALWGATIGRSQLLRFIIVGGVGFVVDAGLVSLLVATTGLGLYWAASSPSYAPPAQHGC